MPENIAALRAEMILFKQDTARTIGMLNDQMKQMHRWIIRLQEHERELEKQIEILKTKRA